MRGRQHAPDTSKVALFNELSELLDSEIAPTLHVSQGAITAYFAEMIRGWPDVSCARLRVPKACATWADALRIAIADPAACGHAELHSVQGELQNFRGQEGSICSTGRLDHRTPASSSHSSARPAGFEPATRCLEGSRSIRLSYGRSRRPLCTEKVTRRLRASRSVSR
jgi:hypothetical protein